MNKNSDEIIIRKGGAGVCGWGRAEFTVGWSVSQSWGGCREGGSHRLQRVADLRGKNSISTNHEEKAISQSLGGWRGGGSGEVQDHPAFKVFQICPLPGEKVEDYIA